MIITEQADPVDVFECEACRIVVLTARLYDDGWTQVFSKCGTCVHQAFE